MFFIGTYNYNLDDKNRLTMPSKLREQLGVKVYVTLGLDKCLAIYPIETFEEKVKEISSLNSNDPQIRQYKRIFFGNSYLCDIDKQGRIQLSKDLLEKCSIVKDVVISGSDNCVEVWDKEKYLALEEEYESLYESNAAKIANLGE